jgi:FG-GAP-like repeat/Secretion system C-terminal sorting domain
LILHDQPTPLIVTLNTALQEAVFVSWRSISLRTASRVIGHDSKFPPRVNAQTCDIIFKYLLDSWIFGIIFEQLKYDQVIKLSSYQVIKLSSYQVIKLSSDRVAKCPCVSKGEESTMLRTLVIIIAVLLPVLVAAQEWTEHTVDGSFDRASSIYAADVDGDGDMDMLGAAMNANDITWWENLDGTGLIWSEHTVDDTFDHPMSVYAEDVDGDGDMDVLGAAYFADDITWWENLDGTGLNWSEHTVDGDFDGAWGVYSADVDGDGDIDVLGAATFADDITWWENLDGTGLSWFEHTVDGEFGGAISVYAEDVDGDGDMDVLGAASIDDDITWWENLDGSGLNWSEHTVDGDFDDAFSVYATDVDGDGDMDVLGAAFSADDITWWENLEDGIGLLWSEHTVDGEFDGAECVYAEDIDGDGDMDVLGAAYDADEITWWENLDGTGLNWSEHTLDSEFDGAFSVYAEDMDGDGDMDVLGAAGWADDITWWEQPGPIQVTMDPISYPVLIPSVGGPFWYSIELTNYTDSIVQGVFTTEAVLPNGNVYGPMLSFNLAIAPGQTLPSPLLQVDVPDFAPVGVYQYRAIFSPFTPYPTAKSDSFDFEKLSAPSAEPTVEQWSFTSWSEAETVVSANDELPSEFSLSQAYPNPFNPTTMINVSLPEAAELNVVVYDMIGRQIATLAEGSHTAGTHNFTIDGSHLASGIYFIQATVPGQMNEVRKAVLMK